MHASAHRTGRLAQGGTALQQRCDRGPDIESCIAIEKSGGPILLEKDRRPAAVIISLEEYQTRFVDVEADRRRAEMVERIERADLELPPGVSSLDLLREIRRG